MCPTEEESLREESSKKEAMQHKRKDEVRSVQKCAFKWN